VNPGQWVALLSGVVAAVAVVIAAIIARGKSRENQLIDQLQEELGRAADERERSARRDRILQNYIYQLNKHIVEGLGPPPPPWPEELFREG
jgi:hypothetical protein